MDTIHYTWPLDQECKHYYTQFGSPGSIPVSFQHLLTLMFFSSIGNFNTHIFLIQILGLASYPCSGNTWSRYLIEGLTGYYTGSIYNDPGIRESGMYGEGVAIGNLP